VLLNIRKEIMPIQAIHENERRHGMFTSAIGGAIVGGAAGYVGKYTLPLTAEEKLTEVYKDRMAEINKEKTTYNAKTKRFLNDIKTKPNRSLAEDEFVKMFDGMKKGDPINIKQSTIRNAILNLQQKSPEQVPAFKNLCKRSLAEAENIAKAANRYYDFFTKNFRPTGFFVVAGAIFGTFVAIANNLMKTEIKTLSN
jgi:hypothetical protein